MSEGTIDDLGDPASDPSTTLHVTFESAGDHTITATATATIPDGSGSQTADDSDTINVKVVEVTEISPKDSVFDEKAIGDTLTKDDFDITTNPAGHEDLVDLTDVTIAIGENVVTATCGTSQAQCTIKGVDLTVNLDSATAGEPDVFAFTIQMDGDSGSFTIAPFGAYSLTGDTSGSLVDGVPFAGTVFGAESGGGTAPGIAPGGSTTRVAPIFIAGIKAFAATGAGEAIIGATAAAAISGSGYVLFGWTSRVTSIVPPNADLSVNVKPSEVDDWEFDAVTSTATFTVGFAGGGGSYDSSLGNFWYTKGAQLTANVANPDHATVKFTPSNTSYPTKTKSRAQIGPANDDDGFSPGGNTSTATRPEKVTSGAPTGVGTGILRIELGAGVVDDWIADTDSVNSAASY